MRPRYIIEIGAWDEPPVAREQFGGQGERPNVNG
jgi:hypothetical protein